MLTLCFTFAKDVEKETKSPLKVVHYSDDNLLELEPSATINDLLILNASEIIIGHIDSIDKRIALSIADWPKGSYTLVYTIEGQSYKEVVEVQ